VKFYLHRCYTSLLSPALPAYSKQINQIYGDGEGMNVGCRMASLSPNNFIMGRQSLWVLPSHFSLFISSLFVFKGLDHVHSQIKPMSFSFWFCVYLYTRLRVWLDLKLGCKESELTLINLRFFYEKNFETTMKWYYLKIIWFFLIILI
jgi:hypothetical protein